MSDPASQPVAELSEKEFILLGLIMEEPSHAYGMETKIRDRRMHEWTEIGFSSIYRVLDKLERRELIVAHLVHEGRGATRRVHVATAEGTRAFTAGVETRLAEPCHPKDPAAVAFTYATALPYETLVSVLSRRQEQVAGKAKMMAAALDTAKKGGKLPSMGCEASAGDVDTPPHLQLLFGRATSLLQAEERFLDEAVRVLTGENGQAQFQEWKDWLDAAGAEGSLEPSGSEKEGDER